MALASKLRELACEIRNMRSQWARKTFGNMVGIKPDGTFVTQADLYASAKITSLIEEIFPDEPIVCEEMAPSVASYRSALAAQYMWIVDPLDNTRSYIEGRDDYSILVVRKSRQAASCAFVLHPEHDIVTSAQVEDGAWRNNARLKVSRETTFALARRIAVYSHSNALSTCGGPPESTEALLAVAAGEVDIAFIRLCGHRVWDIAFALVLIPEAGGLVTNESGGDISLESLDPEDSWIVASNAHLHDAALRLLRLTENGSGMAKRL